MLLFLGTIQSSRVFGGLGSLLTTSVNSQRITWGVWVNGVPSFPSVPVACPTICKTCHVVMGSLHLSLTSSLLQFFSVFCCPTPQELFSAYLVLRSTHRLHFIRLSSSSPGVSVANMHSDTLALILDWPKVSGEICFQVSCSLCQVICIPWNHGWFYPQLSFLSFLLVPIPTSYSWSLWYLLHAPGSLDAPQKYTLLNWWFWCKEKSSFSEWLQVAYPHLYHLCEDVTHLSPYSGFSCCAIAAKNAKKHNLREWYWIFHNTDSNWGNFVAVLVSFGASLQDCWCC